MRIRLAKKNAILEHNLLAEYLGIVKVELIKFIIENNLPNSQIDEHFGEGKICGFCGSIFCHQKQRGHFPANLLPNEAIGRQGDDQSVGKGHWR